MNEDRGGMNRREFLAGTTAALGVGPAGATRGQARGPQPEPSSRSERRPGFPLWCDRGGLIDPTGPSDEEQVRQFVKRCADHGVTRLLPWNGVELLTRVSHEHGLDVQPYLAFNSHVELEVRYAWSVNFIGPQPGTPEGEEILNRHRPIWSHRREQLDITDFARDNRRLWCRDREGAESLRPGQRMALSLAHDEVRAFEIDSYLGLLSRTRADGIQVEFVSVNQDQRRAGIYGYEDVMLRAFEREHGRSPRELDNDAPEWLQFRADYVTRTLRELRERAARENPGAVVSVAVIARPADEYLKVHLDLAAWIREGLIDEFYLWFRTGSDAAALEDRVAHAAEVLDGRCPLVAELSCYHPGSFQDPKVMLETARRAKGSGADVVGIYRSHAVDQLGLWPVVETIAGL